MRISTVVALKLPIRTLWQAQTLRSFKTSCAIYTPKDEAEFKTTDSRGIVKEDPNIKPSRAKIRWTQAEEALLHKLRESKLSLKEIASHFPNRTFGSVRVKYQKIGPRGDGGRLLHSRHLTDPERELIQRLRLDSVTWETIRKNHFPDRKRNNLLASYTQSGAARAYKRQPWSDDDIQHLMNLREVRHQNWLDVGKALGRDISAVRVKYATLVKKRQVESEDGKGGYVRVAFSEQWSEEEKEKLTTMLRDGAKIASICQTFPQRTPKAVRARIHRLKKKSTR